MAYEWIYHRIFMKPHGNDVQAAFEDYKSLLREVVHPVVTEFESPIRHFHFLRYANGYDSLTYTDRVEKPLNIPKENVHFIRLRIEVDAHQKASLVSRLQFLYRQCACCRGFETTHDGYDIHADLGTRFGKTRTQEVKDLLQAASALALKYATDGEEYDPHPEKPGGVAGVMHLMGNILLYIWAVDASIRVWDWQRPRRVTTGP